MKILYFYQYFSTSQGAWGTRVYDFASHWVAQGHDVTVVSSIYAKSDLKATGLVEEQVHNGIRVLVIPIAIDNRQGFLRRVLSFLGYACISAWYAPRLPADVVVASSGPITVGIPGLVARLFRRKPLVFEVRDLWPDGAIEMGILRNPLMIRFARWFEMRCYKNANAIVALSPGMKAVIQQRSGHSRVVSVTNAANITLFSSPVSLPDSSTARPFTYGLYSGNIGAVNQVMTLVDCAEELIIRNRSDLSIVIIGEGQLREEVVHQKAMRNLHNLHVLPLMPKTALVAYVKHALAAMVTLKGSPVLDTSSPNKLFESLAAGVPVIQTTQGWIKDFVEEEGVGLSIPAGNATAMAEALIHLHANPIARKQMGERAAILSQKRFDKDILANDMLEVLKSVAHA